MYPKNYNEITQQYGAKNFTLEERKLTVFFEENAQVDPILEMINEIHSFTEEDTLKLEIWAGKLLFWRDPFTKDLGIGGS